MGTITIHFEGICTQIKLPEPVGTTRHRTVMVHAEETTIIDGFEIPPHWTFLIIDPADLLAANIGNLQSLAQQPDGNWQLLGTRMSIHDSAGELVYDPSTDHVPKLTKLTPDFGELSSTVVYGTDAAGHFDVAHGTFKAAKMVGGAWYTSLDVETLSTAVVLDLEDLIGGNTGSLTFKPDSKIMVTNTGGQIIGDKPWDFLLHYLCAEVMPPNPRYPGEPPTRAAQAREKKTPAGKVNNWEPLGPGCSNSNYP